MQSYGIIRNGQLFESTIQFDGYKLIVHEEIPETFDQTTQYVTQMEPVEEEDRIFIGVQVHNLDLTDETNEGEMFEGEQPV